MSMEYSRRESLEAGTEMEPIAMLIALSDNALDAHGAPVKADNERDVVIKGEWSDDKLGYRIELTRTVRKTVKNSSFKLYARNFMERDENPLTYHYNTSLRQVHINNHDGSRVQDVDQAAVIERLIQHVEAGSIISGDENRVFEELVGSLGLEENESDARPKGKLRRFARGIFKNGNRYE